MQNRWNDEQAATCSGLLDECVYASRLLGADTALVLHGGGNTSVKSHHSSHHFDETSVRHVALAIRQLQLSPVQIPKLF